MKYLCLIAVLIESASKLPLATCFQPNRIHRSPGWLLTTKRSTTSPESDLIDNYSPNKLDEKGGEDLSESSSVKPDVSADLKGTAVKEQQKEAVDVKTADNEQNVSSVDDDGEELLLPWSKMQAWALRDQLPKHTMVLNLKGANGKDVLEPYALWRGMLDESTELRGYPIEFLQAMHDRMLANNETVLQSTPKCLPFMDSYEFSSAGGISGNVFGVPGLADGTKIETSKVDHIQFTLPKGYVRTSDGFAAYELGNSLDETLLANTNKNLQSKLTSGSATLLNSLGNNLPQSPSSGLLAPNENPDQMLFRLAATTGTLLVGATAMNMLSHHLTVNVFWV